jgi:choline dehydrogenase
MIYVRGGKQDYDGWAAMGNPGWSYKDVLPAFKRSEGHIQRDGVFHNAKGELTVCRARGWNALLDVFCAAGQQAGYPLNDDFNGASQLGFGRYDFTIKNGKRWSTSFAFLRPALKRSNLKVVTRARTHKVLVERARAVGVSYELHGQMRTVRARKEVILCAGVVGSPHLLMLSGIGPKEELEQHGIAVLKPLPGVGGNLQDHVDCVMSYECKQPVTLYKDLRFDKIAFSVVQGMLFGEGITTTFPYEAGAFIKTSPELANPDVQLHFMPALEKTANLYFPNPFRKSTVEAKHGFTLRVGPVNPNSKGRIRLRSGRPTDAPMIEPNYLDTEFDRKTMVDAIRATRRIIEQPAFDDYRGNEIAPGPEKQSDEDLVAWLRATAMTTFHPVGTCKMGHDELAVVDHRLKVHGIEGLRVADASIMPVISSGNTNAPAIMIGEKCAEFILAGQ